MARPASPPKVPPETVRTLVVGSPPCPVCGARPLQGRQTVCSAACRRRQSRQRERQRQDSRTQEIRALLEAALQKLEEGSP
jgi:predicted nucleic acid-binding Zn ribbon protein